MLEFLGVPLSLFGRDGRFVNPPAWYGPAATFRTAPSPFERCLK